jgi:hypothetical protein
MGVWVGIDVAKEVHWACVVDDTGQVVWDHQVDNTPAAIGALIEELGALGQGLVVGMDVVGGIANLVQAMLAAAGLRLVYVSGLAVNRARQGTRGGETKSDPRDARVIADQVRTRRDLRAIQPSVELDLEIRLLVGRRRDLTEEQTRRLSRLHDLLAAVHPGLERGRNQATKGGLWLVSRDVTPAEVRAAGRRGLLEHRRAAGGLPARQLQALTDRALAAATAQQQAVPAEQLTAILVRELATEALTCRARLAGLTATWTSCWPATLTRPSSAACPAGGRPGRRVHRPGRRPWPVHLRRPARRRGRTGSGAAPVRQGPLPTPPQRRQQGPQAGL